MSMFDSLASSVGKIGRGTTDTLGTIGGGFIMDSMNRDRKNEQEDKARIEEHQRKMAALGMKELDLYKKSTAPTADQQMMIDRKAAAETAQMKQAMGKAGMQKSTAALSGAASIQAGKITRQEEATNQNRAEHWQNAMAALGMASGSQDILMQMNEKDRQQAMEIYTSTMSIFGNAAGRNTGYGTGAQSEYRPVDYSGVGSQNYGMQDNPGPEYRQDDLSTRTDFQFTNQY
jgi:hypothetical protein